MSVCVSVYREKKRALQQTATDREKVCVCAYREGIIRCFGCDLKTKVKIEEMSYLSCLAVFWKGFDLCLEEAAD